MRSPRAIITAAAAAAILAGCGGSHHQSATASPLSVHGKMTLVDRASAVASLGQPTCEGVGGYSDIAPGAEVVISDDGGKTLAIAHLEGGNKSSGTSNADFDQCTFTFSTSVPSGKGFYSITVTHRGAVKFAEADMASPTVTLGS